MQNWKPIDQLTVCSNIILKEKKKTIIWDTWFQELVGTQSSKNKQMDSLPYVWAVILWKGHDPANNIWQALTIWQEKQKASSKGNVTKNKLEWSYVNGWDCMHSKCYIMAWNDFG